MFDHALAVGVGVIDRAGTGDLVARVTGDVNTLARAVRDTVPTVIIASIELVLTLTALLLLDWRLAAVAVRAGIPIAAVGGRWYAGTPRPATGPSATGTARSPPVCWGSTAVAACWPPTGPGAREQHRLAGRGRATLDAELASTSARNRLRPAVSASLAAALVAVGTALVARDAVTVGAVSASALYVVRLFDPVEALLEELDEINQATAATARLVGVTRLPAHRVARGGAVLPPARGTAPPTARGRAIDLTGVGFGYTPDAPVLTGIDMQVAAGERVVVVGPSGAGKTTLATLICGTHLPDTGTVTLGGTPLAHMDATALPRIVAMVAQDGHVFTRSITDNVTLARPGGDVRAALAAVDALDWALALPDGLDTVVEPASARRRTPSSARRASVARRGRGCGRRSRGACRRGRH